MIDTDMDEETRAQHRAAMERLQAKRAAHYSAIGREGGYSLREARGPEHYSALGKAGAKARADNLWNQAIEAAALHVEGLSRPDHAALGARIRTLRRGP